MKINKQSPPEPVKDRLVETLKTQKNEKYAQNILNGRGEYRHVLLRGVLTAAAVFAVAVTIAFFALIGREIWHADKIVPATTLETPNYIFINGRYAGFAYNGEFSELLLTDHDFSFNEILSNDCLYDRFGKEIKEIYINVSELKALNREETESVASRLKKYASGEFRNYYKFTLPVKMDEEILINTGNLEFAFCEDEITQYSIFPEHCYVTTYKLDIINPHANTKGALKSDEIQKINNAIEYQIDRNATSYTADIDGDGQNEKIVSIASDENYTSNAFSHVIVLDGEDMWFLHTAYQTLQEQEIDKRELAGVVDFDLDGKYELVLQRPYKKSSIIYIYGVKDDVADEVFTIYPIEAPDGITIREFAARVGFMAIGREYDVEYPPDEVCEWYMRLFQTEDMNLDTLMNYNSIYYGIEGFADMYNISLDGWDRGSIIEPLAQIYDPSTTASRNKAEELLQKAVTAFENATVSFDFSGDNITKMVISGKEFSVDNRHEISLIESNLKKLSSLKVTDVEYIGGVTGVTKTIALYTADGSEIFSCSYDDGHIYTNECVYTVEGDALKYIIFGYVVN